MRVKSETIILQLPFLPEIVLWEKKYTKEEKLFDYLEKLVEKELEKEE